MKLGIRSQLSLFSLLLMLVVGSFAGLFLEHQRRNSIEQQIEQELSHYAAAARELVAESKAETVLQFDSLADRLGQATTSRITIIALDGRVLGDSNLTLNEVAAVENHGQRPEVLEALLHGKGIYRRYSTTIETEMLYVAIPFGAPKILGTVRTAKPLAEVDHAISELRLTLIFTGILALLLAILLSGLASHLLTGTLRKLIRHAKSLPAGSSSASDDIELLAGSFNHLAEELESHITELRRMERDQRQFIANASHELRTPVAVIRANAETLLDGAIKDEVMGPKLLQALDRNAGRLTLILADLLDLARIDAKQTHLEVTNLHLPEYVTRAVETLEALAQQRAIKININLEQTSSLRADPQALQQILLNLIENAIKYAPPAGSVEIKSQRQADRMLITVKDSGPGIPESCRKKVFQRFYRVDNGRSREVGGTGLGLSIVKALVEAMQGEVGVEAVEPTGALFWVSLPVS
ncbi:MAG: ATP-binding protein [Candidatus Polarisedimenticolaceae bacterium]|nr:ATP-binding protein [Candidatus Polarisedimenticolaceae bacterium]